MRLCLYILLTVFTLEGARAARAQGAVYWPLDQGWEWEYAPSNGTTLYVKVDGFHNVIGVATTVRKEVRTGASPDSLENYWTVSDSGDVFLHGAVNFAHSFVIAYDPPILFIDPPLVVGKQWSTVTQPYQDLEGTVPLGDPFAITFEVKAMEDRIVPAGTFVAYAIGQPVPVRVTVSAKAGSFSLLGSHRGSNQMEDMFDWYSDGVGPIERWIVDKFRLASWFEPATPVRRSTWGHIKAIYEKGD